jgi:hypothetical protein
MRAYRLWAVFLALAGVFSCVGAIDAQSFPVDIELGYRFVDISGNDGMYRTQINDRPGLMIRSLNYDSPEPVAGLLDHVHLDASDVGAGPAGALRFSASQVDRFRLSFTWRRTDLFSSLPAFANPFLTEGIVPGQHTYNRTRDVYDATLEILPGNVITPILGYTRNVYRGPGRTTYFLGQNEFALNDDVHSRDEEYRVGLAFNAGPVEGAVTQGWRRYRWTDTVSLSPGAAGGNNSDPVLGQSVNASAIDRTTENRVNTPVTSAWVTGHLLGRVKLIGSYARANASGDTNSAETDAGNFVSFQISRFFSGLQETISSRAKTDYWRGSARAEINLVPHVDLTGGWTERSRTLDGIALISSLYLDAVTFAGVKVGDLLKTISATTAIDRTDTTYDAAVTARQLGPLAVNAGWSQTKQDVTVTPDASEIVVPGGEGGRYQRTLNTYGGGLTFNKAGLTLGGDYRRDEANQQILRTDFVNRDRYKVRASWIYADFVRVGGTWQESHANDGDTAEVGYHTRVREVAADLEVTLFKRMLTLRASAGEFKADRNILIRVPQDFTIEPSIQKEIGHTWEGGVSLALSRFTLDAGYLWFQNGGSIPFTIDRARVRAEFALTQNLGVAGEWLRDKYDETIAFDQAGPLSNYRANRYFVGVHWKP